MRGVAGAARGVEADPPRRQVGAQVGGEVAGGAVVGGDQQRRAAGEAAIVLEQGREQQRPQHRRGRHLDLLAARGGLAHAAAERVHALVLGGDLDQRAKGHLGGTRHNRTGLKLRSTPTGLIVEDPERERWVSLPPELDMLTVLGRGAEGRAEVAAGLEGGAAADPTTAGLPFEARSLRAFSLWPAHYEGSARMLVKRFFPEPVQRAAAAYERVTRRTFPPFKPNKRFHEVPAFYVGNHAATLADGEEMPWPSHT